MSRFPQKYSRLPNKDVVAQVPISLPKHDRRPFSKLSHYIIGDVSSPNAGGTGITGYFGTTFIYVDAGRTDSYIEDGSDLRPYRNLLQAVNRLNDMYDNATDKQSTCYVLHIASGTYDDDIEIGNFKYLCFYGYGVYITGKITVAQTDIGGTGEEQISRIEFVGIEGYHSNQGAAMTINGDIDASKTVGTMSFISFIGCSVTGNFIPTIDGIWRLQFGGSTMNGAVNATGLVLGTVLLEAMDNSIFTNPISGNVSLYRVDHTTFNCDIDIDSSTDGIIMDATFTESIDINGSISLNVDLISLKAITDRSPTLTGVTLVQLDYKASTTYSGAIELATMDEVEDGTSTDMAVTPYNLENQLVDTKFTPKAGDISTLTSSLMDITMNDILTLYWMGV